MTYLVELTAPRNVDGEPNWILHDVVELNRALSMATIGNIDLIQPATEILDLLAHRRFNRRIRLAALAGEAPPDVPLGDLGLIAVPADDDTWPRSEVLASASAFVPLNENLTLLEGIEVPCAPGHDSLRAQILAEFDRIGPILRRDTLLGYSWHAPNRDLPAHTPSTGSSSVPLDAETQSFLDAGYELEHVECLSKVNLPVSEDILAACEARVSTDYVVERMPLPIPAKDRDRMRMILALLEVEMPTGSVDYDVHTWTEERLASWESRASNEQREVVLVVGRHSASGDVVAFTTAMVKHASPDGVMQLGTLVLPEHRGHGVGWGIKAAGLRELARHYPARTYLTTENSADNPWMLAINDYLGFELWTVSGSWKKSLASSKETA